MKKFLTCAALSVVLLSGCSLKNNHAGIIKVNDTTITQAEFDKAFDKEINNSMFKAFGGASNFVKSEDNIMYIIYRDKVTNELIVKALIDDEVAKRGITVSDDDIKEGMKSIIDKVGSKDELNNLLKQRGVSNSEFNEDLKTQIKMKKLVESIQKVKISDADAEKYYNQNINQFKHGEQVRASHILISADTLELIRSIKAKNKDISPDDLNKKVEEKIAAQKEKAEAILKEVKANPDRFEELARKNSDDKTSGEKGGELGYFSREAMVPEFSKAAFELKPSTIADNLVKTHYGYHIIKVTDRMEAGITPFAKVKDEIKFYLETQEQIKILRDLTTGLMKTAKIEYLDDSYKPDPDAARKAAEASQAAAKEMNKTK